MISLEGCAYHEAGHAVVGHLLGHKVKRIRIGISGGATVFDKPPQDPEHLVLIAYAGGAAQEYHDRGSRQHWHSQDDYGVLAMLEADGHVSRERRLELRHAVLNLIIPYWALIDGIAVILLRQKLAPRRRPSIHAKRGGCLLLKEDVSRQEHWRRKAIEDLMEGPFIQLPQLKPRPFLELCGSRLECPDYKARQSGVVNYPMDL